MSLGEDVQVVRSRLSSEEYLPKPDGCERDL